MAPPSSRGGDSVPWQETTDPRQSTTAEVCHTARGVWEVLLPDGAGWRSCETLTTAKRVAARWAQDNPPSELIVRDAYHRVVLRKTFT